ncbi:CDP-glycerol glycerophosphotransferase family protein [Bacillus sp. F19]|nr:CDP-glycerol glycerophosphotransferase family protein [Bacillus sp. F19]
MYGESEANDFHLLKYGLLYDFYQIFSPIKIYGLPLAQCLTGPFLNHIQRFVDQNRKDNILLSKYRNLKDFQTMEDINRRLISLDDIAKSTIMKKNTSILMSEDYFDFAADHLKEYQVTMYGFETKRGVHPLPLKFRQFNFNKEIKKVSIKAIQSKRNLIKLVNRKVNRQSINRYFLTETFKNWFINASIGVSKWVYMIDQLILRTRPTVIIDPVEASIFGTILGLFSKRYQIPFVNMPIMLIGDRSLIPSRSDYFFVWGINQKNWLLDRGIEDKQITVSGNIKYYYELRQLAAENKMFKKKFIVPGNHLLAGFSTQPCLAANQELESWIYSIPDSIPISILIKKHKSDEYQYPLLNKKKNVAFLTKEDSLYEFLHQIDCLMTISSNTAIEAALLSKPLLVLQPPNPYHYHFNHNQINTHLAKAQAGEIIKNKNQLIQALNRLAIDEEYKVLLTAKTKKFLAYTNYTVDQSPFIVKKKLEEIIGSHTQG